MSSQHRRCPESSVDKTFRVFWGVVTAELGGLEERAGQ